MEPVNKINDRFDFIVFTVIALTGIGLVAIYSATNGHPTAQGNFQKQYITAIISLVLFFVAYFIPYKTYRYFALPSYAASLFLLVLVLFVGKTIYGAKSWISFGPIGFQPSEFAKIGVILFLSYYLTKQRKILII